MPEVTEFLSKIAIPPRDALPLELQEVLKKVAPPPTTIVSTQATSLHGIMLRDNDQTRNREHSDDTPHTRSPYNHHTHCRSFSLSYANVSETAHEHEYEDNRSDDGWSTHTVVDENLFDSGSESRRGGSSNGGEGNDSHSEATTQSSYVSILRNDQTPSAPSTTAQVHSGPRHRTRTRSCGPWHEVGQAGTDQLRAFLTGQNEQSQAVAVAGQPFPAGNQTSPATMHASFAEKQCVGLRPRRTAARFSPEDPTKRYAMYISPLVWPADGSMLSSDPDAEDSKSPTQEPASTSASTNPAKRFGRKLVQGALKLGAKS